jgi:cytochrome c oxidase subunit 2
MPIAIRIVSEEKYTAWLSQAAKDLPGAYKALIASADKPAAASMTVAANVSN